MQTENHINRREFIHSSVVSGAAFTIVPRHVLGGIGHTAPSEKLNIAGIGVGGMGATNLRNMETENIVALCDVDEHYADKTFSRYPKARRYRDYRKMLDEQQEIDAIMIATPDHTHAVIAMAALKAGKHLYCEKPISNTIDETRRLTQAAAEANVVTQMGNQGRSAEGSRRICEWIWDGAIGPVREVEAWCSLSYYPWGRAYWSTTHPRKPSETPPIPDALDWDLWIGPAAYRDYHPCYHPGRWRAWWEFGSGMMGDRGCHTLDPVFWALKLGHPTSVEASVSDFNEDTHPVAAIVRYNFPARNELPPLKLTWYEGLIPPRPDELEDSRRMGHAEGGVLFKGDRGMLMCGVYGDTPQLIPYSRMREYRQPEQTLPRVPGSHQQGWIQAIKEGRKAVSDFSVSGPLTEVALLGNVAKRMQTKLDWNGTDLMFPNHEQANRYVSRSYRNGWTL